MPTGTPAASQPDHRHSARPVDANRLRSAVAARSAAGTLSILLVQALSARTALAASLATNKLYGVRHELVWPTLCGMAGIAVFLILHAGVRLTRAAFARNSNRKGNGAASAPSVEQFVEDARKLHIDPEIARETFQKLASLLAPETSFGVHDELRGALRLSEQQIDSLLSALGNRSRLPVSSGSALSVYDLLQYVQTSPKSTSGQFYLRSGAAVQPSITSPASPLSDLQNASPRDSRFRTRAHFSGVKRRASDYSGPYRRATDRLPEGTYSGPLRRASDRQDAGTGHDSRQDSRVGDRRSSERRAVVLEGNSEPAKQHRAVSADTSLLNQCLNVPNAQTRSETELAIAPASSRNREGRVQPIATLQRG